MAFVKLDCGILDSTLWVQRPAREVFLTALLMAQPIELREPMPQIEIDSPAPTGFVVPPGWYGWVSAAGSGIVRRADADAASGQAALVTLGSPESDSRTPDFDGRRMVRVDGGFIILNFFRYRDKDASTKERSARYRQRQKERIAEEESSRVTPRDATVTSRDSSQRVTARHQAEAEAEGEGEGEAKGQKTKTARKRAVAVEPPLLPSWVDAQAWRDYEAMRAVQKKPMTPAARMLAVAKLAQLRDAGHDPTEVMRQSTFRGWVGLFPLRADDATPGGAAGDVGAMSKHGTATMRNAQALEQRLFDREQAHET